MCPRNPAPNPKIKKMREIPAIKHRVRIKPDHATSLPKKRKLFEFP